MDTLILALVLVAVLVATALAAGAESHDPFADTDPGRPVGR
jgi:hypothetical protein